MFLKVLRAKLHRGTVTQADIEYVGSIAIDPDIYEAVGMLEGESVLVSDINNGARFETYVAKGQRGTGMMCVNGAAARLVSAGDRIIVMAFGYMTPEEARANKPGVLLLDEKNRVVKRLS